MANGIPSLVALLIYRALADQMDRFPQENDNICANHFLNKLTSRPISRPVRSLQSFMICIFNLLL